MKVTIDIPESQEDLTKFNDRHIAFLWHVAQHNPASIEDKAAGDAAERIGREIIRRWLIAVPPTLWSHQACHHYWHILQQHGKWVPLDGDENNRKWVPNDKVAKPEDKR
jgi:hypothetical protein